MDNIVHVRSAPGDIGQNVWAFLWMIKVSELGRPLIAASDSGYNVLVGATASKPLLFPSYAAHPNILNRRLNSTAAGAYQLLGRYFSPYKALLKLPDFGPISQDRIAIQQMRERSALAPLQQGDLATAIDRCSNIWASFPGSPYGQHTNTLDYLRDAYTEAGGSLK